jgi:hypothetical protein
MPVRASLAPGETLHFQALVTVQGPIPQSVTWTIETLPNGSPRDGWIESDGTYHAPQVVSARHVLVRATSTADPSKAGFADVALPARTIAIAPTYAEVMSGDTVQFSAGVTGVLDAGVLWVSGCGTIDQNGLLQASDYASTDACAVQVQSLSSGDSATASVLVLPRPAVLTGTSGPGAPGDILTIYGTGFRFAQGGGLAAFSSAGEPVLAECRVVPGGVEVKVPVGALAGPLYVLESKGGSALTPSNAIPFERAPRLRIQPDRRDLSAGESTHLRLAFLGAPGIVDTIYATVRACVTGTTNCTGVLLGIHPFRVAPDEPLVQSGGSLALGALVGGQPVEAAFSIGAGGGTLTPDGGYTASHAIEDAGPVWISANQGASVETVQVGVSGLVPGLTGRIFD